MAENKELEKIRHYKGTLSDFKTFWDSLAGSDTNAYQTPEYQSFGGVHPTRGSTQSPHWKNNENEMKKITEDDWMQKDDESSMILNQLSNLIEMSEELQIMITDDQQFDAWVQMKVTKATDYITSVYQYLKGEELTGKAGMNKLSTFNEWKNKD